MNATVPRGGRRPHCPACGWSGKPVKQITLQSLLKPERAEMAERGSYLFCPNPCCETVYFPEGEGTSFSKSQLTVRVGLKETDPPRTVCYCFNHTLEEIQGEVKNTGTSHIADSIKQKCREGLDRCEETNPKGSCCLGDVRNALKVAQANSEKTAAVETAAAKEAERPPVCCGDEPESEDSVKTDPKNLGRWAALGTLLAAVLSSACCWAPILLLAAGVSGIAVSSTLEQYRPLFITLTFLFLGAAFYFAYRPNLRALRGAGDADECCSPTPGDEDCRSSKKGGKRFASMGALNKGMLWVVTGFALIFVFFPNYVGTVLGGSSSVSEGSDLQQMAFRIEGMTCEGCAVAVTGAIKEVAGTAGVEVDLEKGIAVVEFLQISPHRLDLIANSVNNVGFEAFPLDQQNKIERDKSK